MIRSCSLLLLLLFAPACLVARNTVNEPLSGPDLVQLKPGTSTASDVAQALGAPTEVVQLGQRMAWRYDFTNEKTAGFTILILTLINRDTRADRAWVFFDEHNLLLFASSSLQAANAEYAMPWSDVHERD